MVRRGRLGLLSYGVVGLVGIRIGRQGAVLSGTAGFVEVGYDLAGYGLAGVECYG